MQLPLQNGSYRYFIFLVSAIDHLSECVVQSSLHPSYLMQDDTGTDTTQ